MRISRRACLQQSRLVAIVAVQPVEWALLIMFQTLRCERESVYWGVDNVSLQCIG
jgi:hypothetical protein